MTHIPILYQDNDIIIVNKPHNLPTQQTKNKNDDNLLDLLKKQRPDLKYLALQHRLDAPTSGLLLLTCSQKANKNIANDFKNNNIKKIYQAITISPQPLPVTLNIEQHIAPIPKSSPQKFQCLNNTNAKQATTLLCSIDSCKIQNLYYTLTQLQPITGRTHQLRVHLTHINTSIIGDKLYALQKPSRTLIPHITPNRLYLHAQTLECTHPIHKKIITITAPTPKEFNELWNQIKIASNLA